ncbi:MAG: RluA family pseudouridine synthase [Schwartzia sp.]|nr:RluA family pseudouridine synthase [Schwartzia sp. (in: firmicutes)]
MILEYILTDDAPEQPVKNFLRHQGLSSHFWKRMKFQGTLTINGVKIERAALASVRAGDRVRCEIPEHSPVKPEALPLDIRYEDDALLIVNKPAPMLVHPLAKEQTGTLAGAVTYYYRSKGEPLIFHPMHRLDRNTTGLVLIAKLPHIQAMLTSSDGLLAHRSYLAVVRGRLPKPEGTISAPIRRKPGSLIEQEVHEDGKPAITEYRVLREGQDASLLELRPQTGRTHQLRVHLAFLGHPLLGDDLYGEKSDAINRQSLHAYRIDLTHPVSRTPLCVSAPPPEDFLHLLRVLWGDMLPPWSTIDA